MQGTIRCALIATLLLACHTDDTDTPDATSGMSGLVVKWSSDPSSFPANLDNNVTIESAQFALDSLRVVGDAGPGDPRTTTAMIDMLFNHDGSPEDVTFSEAPPGLYSQVALDFDGHLAVDSFKITGKVVVNSQTWDYRVEDDAPLAFNVSINTTASPGKTAKVELRINFVHALDSVNWSTVPESDGKLELEGTNSQMLTFRTKLIESFEVINATGIR